MALSNGGRSSDRVSVWPSWQENKLFTVLLGILLAYLIVFMGAKIRETMFASNNIGYADQPAPMLSVNATGITYVSSDVATLDLGIANTAATAAAAQDANTKAMNAMIAGLREAGLADEDMKTSAYNVYPQYDYNQSPAVVVSYEASQTLTVKIRNQDLVSTVLEKAGILGATSIGSLRYEADDRTTAEAEARQEAIAQAYEQALRIADTMGARLGRVVSYSESSGVPSYGYGGYAYDYAREESSSPTIQPGEEEVAMTVYINYALE